MLRFTTFCTLCFIKKCIILLIIVLLIKILHFFYHEFPTNFMFLYILYNNLNYYVKLELGQKIIRI